MFFRHALANHTNIINTQPGNVKLLKLAGKRGQNT